MNPLKLLVVAEAIQSLSKDPSTKVSAIICDDFGAILSSGFNGLPIGCIDSSERLDNREIKYSYIVHAEMNAICFAARNGVKLLGANLLVTKLCPCSSCSKAIAQSGIKRVYVPKMSNTNVQLRWNDDIKISKQILSEAGVDIIEY